MDRAELKSQVDELMCQYDVGEIDPETYALRRIESTSSPQGCTPEHSNRRSSTWLQWPALLHSLLLY